MLAADARVNENGPASRHLELTDPQLSDGSAAAAGRPREAVRYGAALASYGRWTAENLMAFLRQAGPAALE